MKKLIAISLIAVMLFALCSCQVSVSTNESSDTQNNGESTTETSKESSGGTEETETETEGPAPAEIMYEAVPMPNVKADRIEYFPSDLGYEFFIYQVDGKYGTIGADGKVISEPVFSSASYYYSEDNKIIAEYVDGNFNDFRYIDKDGKIVKSEYYGWGMEAFASVYWYNGAPLLFGSDAGIVKYSQKAYTAYGINRGVLGNQLYFFSPEAIAVKELESYKVNDNGYGFSIETKYKTDRYALMDSLTGKLLTGFIFDDVFSDVSFNGAIAVKLGDMWAYANEKGEVFTEYKFTPADIIEQYDWEKNDGSIIEIEEFYMPVNGYIVTRNDNGFGLIDTSGKTIIENSFEFVSQVNPNGQFWILDDGVWSICTIK